jgi:hypothetical protein
MATKTAAPTPKWRAVALLAGQILASALTWVVALLLLAAVALVSGIYIMTGTGPALVALGILAFLAALGLSAGLRNA